MSRTPHFFLEKYNHEEGEWQSLILYKRDSSGEMIETDFFPYNAFHDLFNLLEDSDSELRGIRVIKDIYELGQQALNEISEWQEDRIDYLSLFDNNPNPVKTVDPPLLRVITYADLLIYSLQKAETFDPNPVDFLIKRIEAILSVYDPWRWWEDERSDIRIAYWID